MVCKNCGNNLTNGSYCMRCGTENNEQEYNEQIETIKKEINRNNKSQLVAKVYIVIIIVLAIIEIGYFFANNSHKACLARTEKEECIFGNLCLNECTSINYITLSILHFYSFFSLITISPIFLILYIYYKFKEKV